MEFVTHALLSFLLARAILPRARWTAWLAIIFAGTFADLDGLSAFAGPSTYLNWHFTYLHAAFTTVVVASLLSALSFSLLSAEARARVSFMALISTALIATFVHLALDVCQSDGVTLFWPLRESRVAADWLAPMDPWILIVGVAAISLPELLHLVSDEIGAKDKRPRGRIACAIAFTLIFVYVGIRGELHSNVLAALDARTYQGELPRRAGAFPEPASIITWHGIVETDQTLHELDITALPQINFDAEGGVTLFKREDSASLQQARASDAARRFLVVARFPKASVEKTAEGTIVELEDLRFAATGQHQREVVALIVLDYGGKIVSEELLWADAVRARGPLR
jgi:membrane-bound metal-dependent hydrolase YbcI (DUF457 family)